MIELELLREAGPTMALRNRQRKRRRFLFFGKFGNLGISWQYKQEDVAHRGGPGRLQKDGQVDGLRWPAAIGVRREKV